MASRFGEAEVVLGTELAPILKRWVQLWISERPLHGTASGGKSGFYSQFPGPLKVLAQETDISERRLRGFVAAEFEYVPLTQVDLILNAIGHEEYLSNGMLTVIPNPKWTQEKWIQYMEERGCI